MIGLSDWEHSKLIKRSRCRNGKLTHRSAFLSYGSTYGFLKVGSHEPSYMDSADWTELFCYFTEKTVWSVCSVYKKPILSSDNEKAIPLNVSSRDVETEIV